MNAELRSAVGYRNSKLSCLVCLFMPCIVFVLFSEFIFAIAGAVVLNNNSKAKNEPEQVWVQVLVNVILMFCLICGVGSETVLVKNESGEIVKRYSSSSETLMLANFAIDIWGMCIYYQMSSENRHLYQTDYNSLYMYLKIISIYHVILYVLCAGVLLFYCCSCLI